MKFKIALLAVISTSVFALPPYEPKQFCFYSEQSVQADRSWDMNGHHATSVWKTPSGTVVSCTAIYPDEKASSYLWGDKVLVGEVTEFVEWR